MENIVEFTLKEHTMILDALGYSIDLDIKQIPYNDHAYIYKKDKIVGTLSVEERNMFYLFRDNRIVGNKDLTQINFNKRKSKNIRTLIHVRLFDKKLKINCFNMLISDDRLNVTLTDNEFIEITKYIDSDEIIVQSIDETIEDDNILDYLTSNNKSLTYKLEEVKN